MGWFFNNIQNGYHADLFFETNDILPCYDVMYFHACSYCAHFIMLWTTHLQHLYWLLVHIFNQFSTINHVGYLGCFSLFTIKHNGLITILFYVPLSHLGFAQSKNLGVIYHSFSPLFFMFRINFTSPHVILLLFP